MLIFKKEKKEKPDSSHVTESVFAIIYKRRLSTKKTKNPVFFVSRKKNQSVFSTIRTNLPPPVIDAVKLDVCGTLALANEHIN